MAADDQPWHTVMPMHPLDLAGRSRLVSRHVLEEALLADGPQHPPRLGESRQLDDAAQHLGEQDGIALDVRTPAGQDCDRGARLHPIGGVARSHAGVGNGSGSTVAAPVDLGRVAGRR